MFLWKMSIVTSFTARLSPYETESFLSSKVFSACSTGPRWRNSSGRTEMSGLVFRSITCSVTGSHLPLLLVTVA
jgi:hypothetical protein